MIAKKSLFGVWLVLSILTLFVDVTVLQFLPVIAIIVILAFEIWAKKNLQIVGIVLSALMIFINLATFSGIDVVMWTVTLAVYSLVKYSNK